MEWIDRLLGLDGVKMHDAPMQPELGRDLLRIAVAVELARRTASPTTEGE